MLSEHFSIDEFKCRDNCGEFQIDMRLIEALEALRQLVNKPIHVNSGFRCQRHNQAIGGSANSQHTQGKAADIGIAGLSSAQMKELAEQIPEFKGIGLYDDFIHVDIRDNYARWDYRS